MKQLPSLPIFDAILVTENSNDIYHIIHFENLEQFDPSSPPLEHRNRLLEHQVSSHDQSVIG